VLQIFRIDNTQKRLNGFNLPEGILARDESRVKLSSVRDPRIAGYHRGIRARGDRKYDTGGVSVRCKSIERYGPRRRDGTGRNGRAGRDGRGEGGSAGRALSDIFVTVAPANIRQVAIILHSIGARTK